MFNDHLVRSRIFCYHVYNIWLRCYAGLTRKRKKTRDLDNKVRQARGAIVTD